MAEPDFDQLALATLNDPSTLGPEPTEVHTVYGPLVQMIAAQLRQVWNARGQDVAYQLAPWFQHHSRCARVVKQGTCDCGLNDALKLLKV